jgi:hypothetical protein
MRSTTSLASGPPPVREPCGVGLGEPPSTAEDDDVEPEAAGDELVGALGDGVELPIDAPVVAGAACPQAATARRTADAAVAPLSVRMAGIVPGANQGIGDGAPLGGVIVTGSPTSL